jgi:hypothetical protein
VVECARLESVYTARYQGFESLTLRRFVLHTMNLRNLQFKNPRNRKLVGVLFIIIGLAALLTPFTPGSWLALIGLELLGIRLYFWDRLKGLFKSS